MAFDRGCSSSKELACCFHVAGKCVTNSKGESQYNWGSVRVRSIKEGITVGDLRLMITSWLGINCNSCDLKYTVSFDETILIDLIDDSDLENLFNYSEKAGHLYIVSKDNANANLGERMQKAQM